MKTIVITGASSGIGLATAKYFAKQGWNVAATMRTPEKDINLAALANVKLYKLDVTEDSSIKSARDSILSDYKKIDVVLNNAGYGLAGPFEAASPEKIRRQFDTNVFGLMEVTRAFLPHFRANKAGLFLNVSSIGGLITFPLISLYHSTKWAVEGFSESLSYELAELGIGVKIIEPGGVATNFGGRSMDFAMPETLPDYQDMVTKFQAAMTASGLGASTAEFLAEGIYNATTDDKAQLRYVIGPDAEQMYEMRKQVGDDAFMLGMKQKMLS
jgi:short-subunit dehydrogenase